MDIAYNSFHSSTTRKHKLLANLLNLFHSIDTLALISVYYHFIAPFSFPSSRRQLTVSS